MSHPRFSAAIVGLGQVGLMFDREAERKSSGEIWTHFSAYEALDSIFNLVAVVDPDPLKRKLALERNPNLKSFATVDEMLSSARVEVVSVCTPDATHLEIIDKLGGRCKGIFLEKPICSELDLETAIEVVRKCRLTGTAMRVNYYKRAEPLVIQAKEIVGSAKIRNVAVRYTGPFLAVGSHALNLMLDFAPDVNLAFATCHQHSEGNGYSGYFVAADGTLAQTIYCGPRNELIFSCEINHQNGAVVIERNLSRLRSYSFVTSGRYAGYRELEFQEEFIGDSSGKRFIGYLEEVALELINGKCTYANVESALNTQAMMKRITRFAEQQS